MYQGNSKENGGIIGDLTAGDENAGVFMDEASETTSAEESLICQDENGVEYSLTASLAISGDITWGQRLSKEEVMRRTVAMSQMTSMMRDNDRNALYEAAIEVCIKNFIRQYHRAPIVLDIGSGTGLLSMMCLKHGAQFVFGVEMFEEMSRIGQEVVNANNVEDNILIINAKSTEIDALPSSVDIIVSEILDSALLGECCIPSHLDAIRRLMSNNEIDVANRIVPNSAEVFGTLLESTEVLQMHDISSIPLGNETSKPNDSRISEEQYTFHGFDPYRNFYAGDCTGGWPLIPIQYSELLARGARPLSESVPIMSVDFFRSVFTTNAGSSSSSGGTMELAEEEDEQQQQEITYDTDIMVTSAGTIHGVALWWKVHLLNKSLDPLQQCSYSTESGVQNWQDHWQQTVFPLAKSFVAKVGDVVRVSVARNNIRMWLNAVLLTSDEIDCSSSGPASLMSPCSNVSAYEGTEIEELDENDAYQVVSSRKRTKRDTSSPTTLSHAKFHHSSTRISSNRLMSSECGCGWHLLCGADRILMMNDAHRGAMWDAAIVSMLTKLYDLGLLNSHHITSSSNGSDDITAKTHNVILDVSDGSMVAISAALKLQQHNAKLAETHNHNASSFIASSSKLNAKVVSKETKFFSKLFFSQLVGVNDIDDYLMVWDGVSFEDISSYWDENEQGDQEGEYGEEQDESVGDDMEGENDDERASLDGNVDASDSANIKSAGIAPGSPQPDYAQAMSAQEVVAHSSTAQIIALISECYNYQLTALPVWQALSFHYQRSALQINLHSSAIIMPQKAFVMAAAFESSQLRQCHGTAGVVCGFDHSPLDSRQSDWFTHSYPYRMANYQKKMLCQPFVVASLDYAHLISGQSQSFTSTGFETSGRCDLVAIWVDYQLTEDPNSLLKSWNEGNFPPHMKVTLKYFQHSQMVQPGSSQLQCSCAEFNVGDSDFNFEFAVVP